MKTIKVVAAIIIHDGKIFATQRGYGEFKDGWEFPGGKIEPGETPQRRFRLGSCLIRWSTIIPSFIYPWTAFCAL